MTLRKLRHLRSRKGRFYACHLARTQIVCNSHIHVELKIGHQFLPVIKTTISHEDKDKCTHCLLVYLRFFIASSQVSAQWAAKVFFKGCDEIQDGLFVTFGSSLYMPEILDCTTHAHNHFARNHRRGNHRPFFLVSNFHPEGDEAHGQ